MTPIPYFDKLERILEVRQIFYQDYHFVNFIFQSYRVNFINQVVRAGDIDKVCIIIGHKNPCTTLIYFVDLKI